MKESKRKKDRKKRNESWRRRAINTDLYKTEPPALNNASPDHEGQEADIISSYEQRRGVRGRRGAGKRFRERGDAHTAWLNSALPLLSETWTLPISTPAFAHPNYSPAANECVDMRKPRVSMKLLQSVQSRPPSKCQTDTNKFIFTPLFKTPFTSKFIQNTMSAK